MQESPTIRASARSSIDPFHAMDVLAEANRMIAAGSDVISLAVGQPSAPAPSTALNAARAMLETGRIGYTEAAGRAGLRARILRHYREAYGARLDPDCIMVTTGSSGGFNLAFLAAFDIGARVAIAAPGYPAYRNILKTLGLVPVEIPVDADCGYILDADRLAFEHRRLPLQGVLIASPANPTGTVTPRDELRRLVEFSDRNDIRFISDEIYHGLTFGGPCASAVEFSDRVIVVNSFSKFYLMTGWRVGWLVLPRSLARATERIAQSLYISAPELSQVAAEAAFDAGPELEAVRLAYQANRDLLLQAMPRLGFSQIAPIDGAFYAYAAVPEGSRGSSALAQEILREAHVALTPGKDFDTQRGERFMRLSYACAHDDLAQALARLEAFFARS